MALGIASRLLFATAHHRNNLRSLHLVECRTALLFGYFTAADKSPVNLFHSFLLFLEDIRQLLSCQRLVDFVDIVEHLVTTRLLLTAGDEVWRERLPTVFQGVHPLFCIHASLDWTQLISLGEDDAERHIALAQPIHEFTVYLLLVVAHIDEYEDVCQLWALQDIAADHLLQLLLHGFGALGEAIARKVDQIPFVIDDKVVDEQGFTRSG